MRGYISGLPPDVLANATDHASRSMRTGAAVLSGVVCSDETAGRITQPRGECVDWRLSRDIVGHDVKTALQMGWAALKNGELLTLASDQFDVFITVDRNLAFSTALLPSR